MASINTLSAYTKTTMLPQDPKSSRKASSMDPKVVAFRSVVHALQIIFAKALFLTMYLVRLAAALSSKAYKATETFRANVFWHFMVWILNPYAVWLFIFWPGWIIVGLIWLWWTW
jgi:hypothetical protein